MRIAHKGRKKHGYIHRIWLILAGWCVCVAALSGMAMPAYAYTYSCVKSCNAEQQRLAMAVLTVHNQVREAVKVPPMTWNEDLAEHAAAWAARLAGLGYMIHSDFDENPDQGENLWMGSTGAFSYEVMVRDWADEGRYFRKGNFPHVSATGNWADIGHFTQMVWRDTREVGCAIASGGGWDYLVCRYSSQGNIIGQNPF